jgi:hypothetical protein
LSDCSSICRHDFTSGALFYCSDSMPCGANLLGTIVGVCSPPLHRSSSRQTVPSTALTSRPALFPTTLLPCRVVPTCLVSFLSLYFARIDLLVAESPLRAIVPAGTPVRMLLIPFIVFCAGRSARSRVVPSRQYPCPGHTRTCAPDGGLSVIRFHSFHCILHRSICS